MPILREIADPYAASTANALSNIDFGNPARSQAEAMTLAAQMRQANAQQQALAQKMRQDEEEQGWKRQKFGWENEDRTYNQQTGDAYGKWAASRMPVPIGTIPTNKEMPVQPGSYGSYGPQPMQMGVSPADQAKYDAEKDFLQRSGRYAFMGGGNAHERAQALQTMRGMEMVAHPDSPVNARLGAQIMTNKIAGGTDVVMPGDGGMDATAQKAMAARENAVAQADETRYKLKSMQDAYGALANKGEIGSWVGGNIGQAWDKYSPVASAANHEAAVQRDLFTAAAKDLETELAKIKLGGQGPITDAERAMLSQMLPRLNDSDPRVGMQIMQSMMDTVERIKARNGAGGATQNNGGGGAPAEAVAELRAALAQGDQSAAREFIDHFGAQAYQNAVGGR